MRIDVFDLLTKERLVALQLRGIDLKLRKTHHHKRGRRLRRGGHARTAAQQRQDRTRRASPAARYCLGSSHAAHRMGGRSASTSRRLAAGQLLMKIRIPSTHNRRSRPTPSRVRQRRTAKGRRSTLKILLETLSSFIMPGMRHKVRLFREQPPEGELRRRGIFRCGESRQQVDQSLIALPVRGAEARHGGAEITTAELGVSVDLGGLRCARSCSPASVGDTLRVVHVAVARRSALRPGQSRGSTLTWKCSAAWPRG